MKKKITTLLTSISFFLKKDKWDNLKESVIILVSHDNNCHLQINKKWYSNIIDSIKDDLQTKSITSIAKPFSIKTEENSYSNAIDFNGSFSRAFIISKILKGYSPFNVWIKILNKTRPKYVLAIQPDKHLCKACRQLGVWVADIQHGVIADQHHWYGEQYRKNTDSSELPNCFLTWDKQSAEVIEKWAKSKNINTLIIGNPWFHKFSIKNKNDAVYNYLCDNNKLYLNKEKIKILISLQWGLDDEKITPNQDLFNNKFIPKELEKLITNTAEEYLWIIRLHPVQLNQKEEKPALNYFCKISNNKIINVTNHPLPMVLEKVDLHITYSSSVVIEATWFNKPSAILDPQIKSGLYDKYYLNQRKQGYIDLIECDAIQIKNWIKSRSCDTKKWSISNHSFYDNYSSLLKSLNSN